MKLLLVEPFYRGSHKLWADNVQSIFSTEMDLLTLPGKYWKWRMEGSAWKLADEYQRLNKLFDIIICSDLINLSAFLSLIKLDRKKTMVVMYMHENQINYPWNTADVDLKQGRDRHYGFMNLMNCLVADKIFFNSDFHKNAFIESLHGFVKPFPDAKISIDLDSLKSRSKTIPIPLELQSLIKRKKNRTHPRKIILWNHRWEYDKNPDLFFSTLSSIKQKGFKFNLVVVGEKFSRYPEVFDLAKHEFKDEIVHFGYVESRHEYETLLEGADILPVTSNHDFFGISVIEAIAAGVTPLLPNRLAYPEHINPDKFPHLFYDHDQEFEGKLTVLLSTELTTNLKEKMLKYDMTHVSGLYKNALQ